MSRGGAASGGPPGGGSMRAQARGQRGQRAAGQQETHADRRSRPAAPRRPAAPSAPPHDAPQQLPLLHQHLALLLPGGELLSLPVHHIRTGPGTRTARSPASSPATPPGAASRSTSVPSRPHSRPMSMASPSGTKTAVPSESTACPPTRSRFSPSVRAESLARRSDGGALLLQRRGRGRIVAPLTTARTTWPG